MLHRLTFGAAIARDLLADYRVVVVGVDDAMYREYAEQGTFVTRDGDEVKDARALASSIGLARAMHTYDLRRVLTFHHRIAFARRFQADLPDIVSWMPEERRPTGRLRCAFVSGEMPSGERKVRIDHLRHIDVGERPS